MCRLESRVYVHWVVLVRRRRVWLWLLWGDLLVPLLLLLLTIICIAVTAVVPLVLPTPFLGCRIGHRIRCLNLQLFLHNGLWQVDIVFEESPVRVRKFRRCLYIRLRLYILRSMRLVLWLQLTLRRTMPQLLLGGLSRKAGQLLLRRFSLKRMLTMRRGRWLGI